MGYRGWLDIGDITWGITWDSMIGVISHEISHGILGGNKIVVISPEISHDI